MKQRLMAKYWLLPRCGWSKHSNLRRFPVLWAACIFKHNLGNLEVRCQITWMALALIPISNL